jgi:hypothetical protein
LSNSIDTFDDTINPGVSKGAVVAFEVPKNSTLTKVFVGSSSNPDNAIMTLALSLKAVDEPVTPSPSSTSSSNSSTSIKVTRAGIEAQWKGSIGFMSSHWSANQVKLADEWGVLAFYSFKPDAISIAGGDKPGWKCTVAVSNDPNAIDHLSTRGYGATGTVQSLESLYTNPEDPHGLSGEHAKIYSFVFYSDPEMVKNSWCAADLAAWGLPSSG